MNVPSNSSSPNEARPIEVDCDTVNRLLQSVDEVTLIDCREPDEHAIGHIAGAVLLPMSQIGDRLEELQQLPDQATIVYCHHGGRSLRVAMWMRQQGIPQAQSMAGGIDVWSQSIDPSIPRY